MLMVVACSCRNSNVVWFSVYGSLITAVELFGVRAEKPL